MRKFYSFLIILFASIPAIAQTDSSRPVTILLDSAKIDTLVLELEKQTDLHFYYNATHFDSLIISINVLCLFEYFNHINNDKSLSLF